MSQKSKKLKIAQILVSEQLLVKWTNSEQYFLMITILNFENY